MEKKGFQVVENWRVFTFLNPLQAQYDEALLFNIETT